MPDKLRWGVLGTAKIAIQKVIPGMRKATNLEVLAIASRDEPRAREAAAMLHLARFHGSYQALLDDPDVDAVYVPLPNNLHLEWTVRALEAGKHVLVEKPVGMDTAEARALADAATRFPRLRVMEGFMYRFHPQWREAKRLVDAGEIGALQQLHAHFSYRKFDPRNIRNRPETGGGGLMDIGCYGVSLARFLYGREPERVVATMDVDPELGVDRLASAILDFGGGATASFVSATQMEPYQRVHAHGGDGRIEIEVPFNAPPLGTIRLWHGRGDRTVQTGYDGHDQYALQGEAFSRAVLEGAPVPTPLSDAVANMQVIDAIRESASSGGWVSPARF